MKQRITVEQLNELNDEQRDRLRQWWTPQIGDLYAYSKKRGKVSGVFLATDDRGPFDDPESNLSGLPLLSIGQMFQYLEDMKDYFTLYSDIEFDEASAPSYVTSYKIYGGHSTESNVLVDALWERVKENLK